MLGSWLKVIASRVTCMVCPNLRRESEANSNSTDQLRCQSLRLDRLRTAPVRVRVAAHFITSSRESQDNFVLRHYSSLNGRLLCAGSTRVAKVSQTFQGAKESPVMRRR